MLSKEEFSRIFELAKADNQGLHRPELEKEIARIVCCLSDDPQECEICNATDGCPDSWSDVREKVDKIAALIPDEEEIRKQERERIISFMRRQGAVFADKTHEVTEAIRKGKHLKSTKGEGK